MNKRLWLISFVFFTLSVQAQILLPSRVESQSFSAMSGIISASGQVSNFDAGDWVEYYVSTLTASSFSVQLSVATVTANAQLQVKDGATLLTTINAPNTGDWSAWQPTTPVTISLSAGSHTLRFIASNSYGINIEYIDFLPASSSNNWSLGGNNLSDANSFIGTTSSNDFVLKAGGHEGLRIKNSNGLVVVGSANPPTLDAEYKLAVGGSILSEKVKVKLQGSWPDYVFSSSYKLPHLREVETYITMHKHLPGIPSEGEVKSVGIDVGETQKLLLKKIEELTLYAIEQERKLEEQTKQNKALEQRLQKLEQRLRPSAF